MALVHPIFSVLVGRPHLLADHLAGYAELAQEEAGAVGTQLLQRALAWAVCGVSALVGIMLAGVAIMLGAVTTAFAWALVLVPGVPLLLALAAYAFAARRLPHRAFAELRTQWAADLQALRTLGGRP